MWACTRDAASSDKHLLEELIPAAASAGRTKREDWDWAMKRLDALDPHRVFGNEFLDVFAPA